MGRKLGFSSVFYKPRDSRPVAWASWTSCKHPRTDSFRAGDSSDDVVVKTVNSVFFDSADSCFTHTSGERSESFSTASEDSGGGETQAALVRRLRSDRLFFEPGGGGASPSILSDGGSGRRLKESVVLAMESRDPYGDFRASMEEMVAAHGLREWEGLEELLVWYLKVNARNNHGYIIGAFVDLHLGLAASSSSSSSSSSPFLSFEIEEIGEVEEDN